MNAPIARAFYARSALAVARDLLGMVLVHATPDGPRAGVIVETEAYAGERDLASHASKGRTARTDVMFGPPGHAYVYLIYGMHHCVNAVCAPEGRAAAVLIRAVEPVTGIEPGTRTDGPGRLTRALGIVREEHNRIDLCGDRLFVVAGTPFPARRIERTPRIGVDYAGIWASKPYRFAVRDHPCVSRIRRTPLR